MRKYFTIILITVSLYGQYSSLELDQTIYTFSNAVEQYNNTNYEITNKILNNLSRSEQKVFEEEIAFLSMSVKYRLKEYGLSKEIGQAFLTQYPDSELYSDVYVNFGDIFLAEGNYESAFRTFIEAYKISLGESQRRKISRRIYLTLQFGILASTIDEILIFESDIELLQILNLAKVHTEIQKGHKSKASVLLSKINQNSLASENFNYYSDLTYKLQKDFQERSMVAVVLPLSGKHSNIGKELLEGIEYASVNNPIYTVDPSLLIFDNEGDELKTLEIFQSLAKNTDVAAVIGPVSTPNSIVASSTIESFGIPMILPNVSKDGLADVSANIFLMNSNLKTRGKIAAEFIAETLLADNIAVLAPADDFGKDIIDAFVDRLELFGKSPEIIEWYTGMPTNLSRQLNSIRKKAWELTAIENGIDSVETNGDSSFAKINYQYIHRMTSEDSADVILNSIDAIYMPMHKGQLEYIGAQFPVYNLNTTIVGNENWTDLKILRKENIGPHFSDMIAITNYNYHQLDLLNNDFNNNYSKYFYQGIDCYNLLIKSIKNAIISGLPLVQILSNIDDMEGLFGVYNFKDNTSNVNSSFNIIKFDGYNFNDYFAPY